MGNWKKYILISVFLPLFFSCGKDSDCRGFSDETDTKVLAKSLVDSIHIEDYIEFQFHYCLQDSLVVEGNKRLLEEVLAEPIGNSGFHVSNEVGCKLLRRNGSDRLVLKYYGAKCPKVTLTEQASFLNSDTLLDPLDLFAEAAFGSVDLILNNDSTLLNIESGALDLHLSGTSNYGYFYIKGKHHLYAGSLMCDTAHVNHHSTGPVYVWASELLISETWDLGNTYIQNTPNQVSISTSAESKGGQLIFP